MVAMEKDRNTIVVQCYPYGELIYIVKSVTEIDSIHQITLDADGKNRVNGMECANIKETKISGTTLNNWKWNYLYDNVSNRNNLPNLTKTSKMQNDTCNDRTEGHSFYTDFDEFSISLMKKENSEFEIKETDLLENDDPVRISDIAETALIGSDDDDIKETDLIGTDDEFTDVSSLSSLTINNGSSMNRLDRSFNSLPREIRDEKSDLFANNHRLRETQIVDDEINNSKTDQQESLIKFQDLESDYFETDCETMDSGIFPHKETEYFQDIGSDFFDDDDDENITHKITSSKLYKNKRNKKNDGDNVLHPTLSPVSPLPPGKTATMSNSLLRSTICELERALSDSNKLLAKRDEKMQTIRSRNIELKKTLSKEVESNTKMKYLLIEKDKIILENQTKIISLNQEIHEINDKLSKFRMNRLNEIHSSGAAAAHETTKLANHTTPNKPCVHIHTPSQKAQTPERDDDVVKSPNTPSCKSTKRPSCMKQKKPHVVPNEDESKGAAYFPQKDECSINNDNNKNDDIKKDGSDKLSTGELQANLRIKFMRDAFFYYMIGFHPDEQINAILAILEYGDRRQDFVLEAHNMKKVGKKFNVSKVSSRGHSFVQEEFQ